jgi:RNA polymerase sigma-70 factor (ECF subfamily)
MCQSSRCFFGSIEPRAARWVPLSPTEWHNADPPGMGVAPMRGEPSDAALNDQLAAAAFPRDRKRNDAAAVDCSTRSLFVTVLNHSVCMRFRDPLRTFTCLLALVLIRPVVMPSSVPSLQQTAVDFDALFRLYARELNSFAYRRLNDREAAADLVQDGFLRFLVWHSEQRNAKGAASPRFFLWSVVGNLTIDFVRRRQLRGAHAPLDDVADQLADPYPTPDRFLEARQQYRLLKAALDEAPRVQRTALLLNRIEGLTHAEIAQRLGVSPSMVSKYIMAVLERCLLRLSGARP